MRSGVSKFESSRLNDVARIEKTNKQTNILPNIGLKKKFTVIEN